MKGECQHAGNPQSISVTEGLGDQKVSAELAVSVYRNRNTQTHSQTLVASRRSLTPQNYDFPRVLTHAGLRVIRQTREEKRKRLEATDRLGKVVRNKQNPPPESRRLRPRVRRVCLHATAVTRMAVHVMHAASCR